MAIDTQRATYLDGRGLCVQNKAIAAVVASTILISLPSVGMAEQTTAQGSVPQLQEVIVTAQKRKQRLQDVPMSISVLGGQNLDNSNFVNATDALNSVPAVAAVSNQLQSSGTVLSIRGVSAAGYEGAGASTVAYYVDSVPFGMIRSALVPDPDIYDLQRIEVLRGPQGTLYGANSLVGVVRVLTFDPDLDNFDFKARAITSTTENGGANYDGDAAVNIPIVSGVLAARAVVGDDHESGWINSPYLGNHINDGELRNARMKILARVSDSLSVILSAWHSQSQFGAPNLAGSNYVNPSQHAQPVYSQFNAYGLQVNYDLSWAALTSMTSYVDYANPSLLDYTAKFGDSFDRTLTTDITSRVASEEVDLTSKLAGPWRWSAGGMYRDDRDTEFLGWNIYPGPTPSLLENSADSSKSGALYGELGRRFFHDELQWTLGVRYFRDHNGTQALSPIPGTYTPLNFVGQTSQATTPRAVLTWLPSKDFTAYASFSQGFRSGVPQDISVRLQDSEFPPLKPDKLTNYELGAKGNLWDHLVAYDAAIFYMDWQDIQQEVNVPIQGSSAGYIYVQVNGKSASGEGAELELTTQPLDGLSVGANFSWNNLHFNSTLVSGGQVLFPEGSRPNYSPEYTAGLSAKYAFPLGSNGTTGSLSAGENYISALNTTYLTAGTVESNSMLLTNANFTIGFPSHWSLTAFIDNAANWNGSQLPYAGYAVWDTRLRPRTYGLQVNYHLR